MKNSKNVFVNAGQSPSEVKKSQKHDANLQKNSSLYFQIGLILCLLGTYALFEMQFQGQTIVIETVESNDLAIIDVAEKFRVEPDVIPQKKQMEVRKTILTDKVVEVKNDFVLKDIVDVIVTDQKPLTDAPLKIEDIIVDEGPTDLLLVDFIKVEKVPIYPGCERYTTNDERKNCMSEKITKLIHKKFNTDIASEHGLSGVQKIHTQFTIDKNGKVVDIKTRAPHPALEKEAQRIINKIPTMIPGYQRAIPVGVIYNLPISFKVQ